MNKTPPHSLEAEQSVIGTMFLWPETVVTVRTILDNDDWYTQVYRTLFKAFVSLSTADCGLDETTLCDWLSTKNELKRIGGVEAISKLGDKAGNRGNLKAHCEIIRLKSAQRAVQRVAEKILHNGYNPDDPESYPSDSLKDLSDEITKHTKISTENIADGATELVKRIYSPQGAATTIKTGYKEFDDNLGGFTPGLLAVLAGRPRMGKSMTALNFLLSMVIKGFARGLFFTLEDKTENQRFRALSCLSGVGLMNLKHGDVDHVAATKLNKALITINGLPMDFVDKPSTAQQICQLSTTYRYKHSNDPLVIVVDHLGYIRGDSDPFKRISDATRDLCDLAKNTNAAVIALSQLNRQVESRSDNRPTLSDLRATGHIEEDARLVLAVYRDVVYNQNAHDDELELLCLKNTDGRSGFSMNFGCNLPTVKLKNRSY